MKTTALHLVGIRAVPVFALAFAVFLSIPAEAQTIPFTVNSMSDERDMSDDGVCFTASGTCTLRAAIQQANARPSAGTYKIVLPAGTLNVAKLGVSANVIISGQGMATTAINGSGTNGVLDIFAPARVIVENLTISGGGITVTNRGDLTIRNGRLLYGLFETVYNEGFLHLVKSTIEGANVAINSSGQVEIDSSVILSTKQVALYIDGFGGSSAIVRNSSFFNNGGAQTIIVGGVLTMTNSTVSDNHYQGSAAVIYVTGVLRLVNCTIRNNNRYAIESFGKVYMRATIIDEGQLAWKKSTGVLISEGYNIDAGGSAPLNPFNGDRSYTNPMLDPVLDSTGSTPVYKPYPGSPAIDAFSWAAAQSNSLGSSNRVIFVGTDTLTAGNWKGVYGSEGFHVINDTASYPSYVTVTPTSYTPFTWPGQVTDPRGLLKASSSTDRIASCWYAYTSFEIDLNFNDSLTHQVALYLADWDSLARSQRIDIVDTGNNVLDSRNVSSFWDGAYLIWYLSGHVKLRFTNLNPAPGLNAIVNGIFFDRDPGSTVPTTDQRGIARPQYPNSGTGYLRPSTPVFDIGAVEYVPQVMRLF